MDEHSAPKMQHAPQQAKDGEQNHGIHPSELVRSSLAVEMVGVLIGSAKSSARHAPRGFLLLDFS